MHFPPLKWLKRDCNFSDIKPHFLKKFIDIYDFSVTKENKDSITLTGPFSEVVEATHAEGKCAKIKQNILGTWDSQITLAKQIRQLQMDILINQREVEQYSKVLDYVDEMNRKTLKEVSFNLIDETGRNSFDRLKKGLGKGVMPKIKGPSPVLFITLLSGFVAKIKAMSDFKKALEASFGEYTDISGRIKGKWMQFDEKNALRMKYNEELLRCEDSKPFSHYVANDFVKKIQNALKKR